MNRSINDPSGPQQGHAFGTREESGRPMIGMAYYGREDAENEEGRTGDVDTNEKRIAKACDTCQKKKVKCDGKVPKCSTCVHYKTECAVTQLKRKRNSAPRHQVIDGLESRIARMETLLKVSNSWTGESPIFTIPRTTKKRPIDKTASATQRTESPAFVVANSHQVTANQATSFSLLNPASSRGFKENVDKEPEDVENVSDMMGSSSAFSILSSKGVAWIRKKSGDASIQTTIQNAVNEGEKQRLSWRSGILSDTFVRPVFKPLPPKEEALVLLKGFFENFNCIFPLYHEPTFMQLVDKQYSSHPFEGSGWWASINIVIAIAYRSRVMTDVQAPEEDQNGWLYMKNSMSVLTELTFHNTDLLSVQALLGMALFVYGTPDPQPYFVLISAAIRQSHSMGLHKRGSASDLVESEQRKRVFWIAYMLDKDASLRSGRPSVQDDDDMNVELPSKDPIDDIGSIALPCGSKVNLFRFMCEFAVISSKIYRRLHSVQAAAQNDDQLLNSVDKLSQELEAWRESIPLDFRPEHEIRTSHGPLILHIVVLHFSYFNCLATIHRISGYRSYRTSQSSNCDSRGFNAQAPNERMILSTALCVSAARASINLVKYIPQSNFACVWLIINFPVSALLAVFANTLQNSRDPRATEDIRLMELVVNFLARVVADDGSGSLTHLLNICSELVRIARILVGKTGKDSSRSINVDANDLQQFKSAMVESPVLIRRTGQSHFPEQHTGSLTSWPTSIIPVPLIGERRSSLRQRSVLEYENSCNPKETGFGTPDLNHDYQDVLPQMDVDCNAECTQQNIPSTFCLQGMDLCDRELFSPRDQGQIPMDFDLNWTDFGYAAYPGFLPPGGM